MALDCSRVKLSASSTMPQIHPLRDSTLISHNGNTHIVNSKELLVGDPEPAKDSDVVHTGNAALQVVCRGNRIMKNLVHGPDGPNTRDLVLEDVAFIPGFHINLISSYKLEKALSFWFCGFDNTLRYGTMASNKTVMNVTSKDLLLVAE
ncbi:hypothetical protein G6O67_006949 [Ophiocordyceps sinensis]|uniref:Uncharacterized protein n=1 Tax=Ophiocordyceps sinensis TaxID=72228 RepID=A0A8H4LT69_9HYPO|nr:hypothetical protein G6O67_006949 [Ophiocordyceps sinensis]